MRMRKWLTEQLSDLLPVPYFHSVFTVPSSLNVLVSRSERVFYNTLFQAATDTLKALAQKYWQVELGIVAVLHTWGQSMVLHPHVHCIVTGGGLTLEGEWVASPDSFLFDVRECAAEFQKRFCRLLRRRFGKMAFAGKSANYADRDTFLALLAEEEERGWIVYTQPPAAGEANVLRYLSRYVHRVAISNRRITDIADDGTVTFDYKDYRDKDANDVPKHKEMPLSADDFIGRFMRHVLPENFRRIRGYGIQAPAQKVAKLKKARAALNAEAPDVEKIVDSLDVPVPEACCKSCGNNTFTKSREIPACGYAWFRPQKVQKAGAMTHSAKTRRMRGGKGRTGPRIIAPIVASGLSNGQRCGTSRNLNLL
jgi:hypothetical protein